MMERCETCKHWRFDGPDWQFDDLRIGECKAVKMREAIEHEAVEGTGLSRYDDEAEALLKKALTEARAIAVDGSGYYAALRTFKDFGCVLHEPASAIEAPSGGETTQIGSTGGESAVPKGDAHA